MPIEITAPNFPPKPDGLPYAYLGTLGVSEAILKSACIKVGKVVKLNSFETVTVSYGESEYPGIPVLIHTDVGCRDLVIKGSTPEEEPGAYFKNSALMFPFKDVEVLIVVYKDPDLLTDKVLCVIGFHGGPLLHPTYRMYALTYIDVYYGPNNKVAEEYILYDIIENKVANIPTMLSESVMSTPFFDAEGIPGTDKSKIFDFLSKGSALVQIDDEAISVERHGDYDPTVWDIYTHGYSCATGETVSPGWNTTGNYWAPDFQGTGLSCGASISSSYSPPTVSPDKPTLLQSWNHSFPELYGQPRQTDISYIKEWFPGENVYTDYRVETHNTYNYTGSRSYGYIKDAYGLYSIIISGTDSRHVNLHRSISITFDTGEEFSTDYSYSAYYNGTVIAQGVIEFTSRAINMFCYAGTGVLTGSNLIYTGKGIALYAFIKVTDKTGTGPIGNSPGTPYTVTQSETFTVGALSAVISKDTLVSTSGAFNHVADYLQRKVNASSYDTNHSYHIRFVGYYIVPFSLEESLLRDSQ